ncbi:unnamed protein product [Rotaria socialis]|uniref:F-box domain-containing protein n=1 Tax=Rotaria socialis TaxID=392032 RepID=A0A818GMN7_9BILA|nr:unnamed protein product [Rotaria socialis]
MNRLNILDLPNEILFIIFNKLNMVDVLYSFVGINQRFDQLVFDPFYIRNLNMTFVTMKSFYDRMYSINNHVLDKICKNVLPKMYHQINELIVEQNSMERVIHNINYPQLYSLTLLDFSKNALFNHLTSNKILRKLLIEQITHLKVDINYESVEPSSETLAKMFALILSLCKQLIKLNFCKWIHRALYCTFKLSPINFRSSTLTALKVNVKSFDDCLYLLDGRLNCLSKLSIGITIIADTSGTIDNTKKLPKLKHFSLMSYPHILLYDSLIVPLLRRMINLENLILYLSRIRNNKNYIDGNELYNDILIYMPQLNKFTFNIRTNVDKKNDGIVFSSNEDIQHSFRRKEYGLVGSYVETFTTSSEYKCYSNSMPYHFKSRSHIYSLPYQFKNFDLLSNSFEGGMFGNVQSLIMTDIYPFEHNFFNIISQSFPLLKELHIINEKPQKNKQQTMPLIVFSHLIDLNLFCAHADCAEQFLVNKHCYLPCLLNINICYEPLTLVTNNFTNDATRLTCSKLTSVCIKEPFVSPETFSKYFPLL